jgi:hypothetical protein
VGERGLGGLDRRQRRHHDRVHHRPPRRRLGQLARLSLRQAPRPGVANPSVAVWANNTPVAGTYETPLPGNATAFRIRYQTAGTATVIQLSVGSFFTPGVPVRGVLFDVATTAGASNNTGTLDVSGWSAVAVDIVVTTAVTGAASLNEIDDTGAAVALGTSASIAVNTYAFGWGGAFTFGTTNPFTMKGAITSSPLPGRISIATAGATTSAQRIRVWGTR